MVGLAVVASLLARRQDDGLPGWGLVGDLIEQVGMMFSRARFLSLESATCHGANSVLVVANISSQAPEYSY